MNGINNNIQFKADTAAVPYVMSYNNRYTPPMPDNAMDDMFIMQAMEQQKAAKKEKAKEKWYKTGVIAQVALAAAFVTMAVTSIIGLKRGGLNGQEISKNVKLVWDDIAKKQDFPKLTDDCVNPKVRDFIQKMKNRGAVKKEVLEYTGMKNPEQCILMYGPSGTGKTFSGQILAKELGAEYTKVQFADVSSPYIGQTSVEIKNVFNQLHETAMKNPEKKYVVSFDEIDALLVPREKCGANNLHLAENRTAFLNGLDLIKDCENLKIIGTTNVNPSSGNLDKASLSRFKNMIEIDLPNTTELKAALKFQLRDLKAVKDHNFFENNTKEIENLVKELKNKKYSQRDVEDIAKKAVDDFGIAINNSSNIKGEKFDIKYLEEAVKSKGMTTGAIGDEVVPAWSKIPEPTQQIPLSAQLQRKTANLWDKIKSFLHIGNK